jgi:hypothetical protein
MPLVSTSHSHARAPPNPQTPQTEHHSSLHDMMKLDPPELLLSEFVILPVVAVRVVLARLAAVGRWGDTRGRISDYNKMTNSMCHGDVRSSSSACDVAFGQLHPADVTFAVALTWLMISGKGECVMQRPPQNVKVRCSRCPEGGWILGLVRLLFCGEWDALRDGERVCFWLHIHPAAGLGKVKAWATQPQRTHRSLKG